MDLQTFPIVIDCVRWSCAAWNCDGYTVHVLSYHNGKGLQIHVLVNRLWTLSIFSMSCFVCGDHATLLNSSIVIYQGHRVNVKVTGTKNASLCCQSAACVSGRVVCYRRYVRGLSASSER